LGGVTHRVCATPAISAAAWQASGRRDEARRLVPPINGALSMVASRPFRVTVIERYRSFI
jgi:hypothetical protein